MRNGTRSTQVSFNLGGHFYDRCPAKTHAERRLRSTPQQHKNSAAKSGVGGGDGSGGGGGVDSPERCTRATCTLQSAAIPIPGLARWVWVRRRRARSTKTDKATAYPKQTQPSASVDDVTNATLNVACSRFVTPPLSPAREK